MMCPQCEVWELVRSENFCSWCGLALLRFDVQTDRLSLPRNEYSPPIEVTVSNNSEDRDIDVASITSSAAWITLLDPERLPQRIGAGQQAIFQLDADTLTAGETTAELRVLVAHAGSKAVTLTIV